MNLLNKYHTLFVSIVAILAITLAGSHFCSASTHAPSHHTEDQEVSNSVSYNGDSNYQQCCTNNSNEQITVAPQQIQRFNFDTQSMVAATFYSLPISTATTSGSPLKLVLPEAKLDPGGGLVLLC